MGSLEEILSRHCSKKMYSFHTPGHKGRADLLSSIKFPDYDLTELPGLDMLHNPQGVIMEAQNRAAGVYGSDKTFFLVNGATSGNQAMLMSIMSKAGKKKIRLDRRSHRSVIGGLILSGLTPEYISPIVHPDFNLPLGLNHKDLISGIANIGAIHVTSPSYYGTSADLETVIKCRDSEAPNTPILIDQAHGSHYIGEFFPENAVKMGADLVVHSSHKTLNALTQAGMLHVKGNRIDLQCLEKSLDILLTSSPSYLLMASLEKAVEDLESFSLWEDLYTEVMQLHESLNGRLRLLNDTDSGCLGIRCVDWSKILVNLSHLKICAGEAVDILRKDYRIEPELWDKENMLFILGTGSRPEDIRVLRRGLENLIKIYSHSGKCTTKEENRLNNAECMELPPLRLSPREAWFAPKRLIKVKDALGKISGETISIYPPGIPIVACGEEITSYCLDYLSRAEAYNWQGWLGYNNGTIQVVDE